MLQEIVYIGRISYIYVSYQWCYLVMEDKYGWKGYYF